MTKLFSLSLKNVIFVTNQYNVYNQIRYLPRWFNRRPIGVIEAQDYDEAKDCRKVNPEQIVNTNFYKEVPKVIANNETKDFRKEKKQKIVNTDFYKEESKRIVSNASTSLNKTKISWKHPKDSKRLGHDRNDKALQYNINPFVKPLTISNKKNSPSSAKYTTVDMLETIIDEDGNFIYTKMKDNDVRISKILVDIKSNDKEKRGQILLEGKRLIKDALNAGCILDYILFSRLKDVEYIRPSLPKIGAKLFKMPYNEMQLWSNLVTNPGIMGVFKIPDTESYELSSDSLPLTIICDNIREGGNLGTVLRTSSGVGCEKIVLTKGCVNVWDSKVLRSACGAHFKLKLYKKIDWEEINKHIHPHSQVYIADNNLINTANINESQHVLDILNSIPILPYYGVNFVSAAHIVLIIGGETEGISAESYKLASEFKGARLNIPLINNVDSLNTGTALGIIAFEIRRQFMKNEYPVYKEESIV